VFIEANGLFNVLSSAEYHGVSKPALFLRPDLRISTVFHVYFTFTYFSLAILLHSLQHWPKHGYGII
jgi:hypothetical protein